jgi:DNA replication licensing factor MCM6
MNKGFFNFRDELAEEAGRVFFHFLNDFSPKKIFPSKIEKNYSLNEQINLMNQTFSSTIFIDFEHVILFSDELSDIIEEQHPRIELYISEALDEYINKIFQKQEIFFKRKNKKYWIGFYNLPFISPLSSQISKYINRLICISGMVTRISEPYPQLIYGSFLCENPDCKFRIDYVEQFLEYKEPTICPKCHNLSTWALIFENSIFINYQKIRIQEIRNQICSRNIPQTFDLFLKEDLVGMVKPGDKCFFNGFLTPYPMKIRSFFFDEIPQFEKEFSKKDQKTLDFNSKETYFQTCFIVGHLFSMNLKKKKRIF